MIVAASAACASDPGHVAIVEPMAPAPSASASSGAEKKRDVSPGADGAEGDGESPASSAVDASDAARPSAAALAAIEPVRPHLPNDISFLVITIDTLRPDLGCLGYGRPVSPNIDKLAERAVVYERAYSISTYTGFCLTPMMASRYPTEMPRNDRHEVKYFKENVLLAERLRAAGYHTAGAASHFLFAPELGWIDGFERFVHAPVEGNARPGSGVDAFHSSRIMANTAIRLLSDPQITSGPFFIWVHFLDPHKKYLEHPGFDFGDDPRGLYDGEVAFTDFHVGRVLDTLAASPLRERTVVIITADHAEAFGEHGFYFHGREEWEEVVRIPFLVLAPGNVPRHIARRMSVVEFAPTVLELAGLPADPGARGQSLVPELYGGELPERPILIDQPKNPYYPLRRSFIDGGYKLITTPSMDSNLLFDLNKDPGETKDLADVEPDAFRHTREAYEAFMSEVPEFTPRPFGAPPPKTGQGKAH